MLKFQEVSVLDSNSEALGVPTLQLMENAGSSVAEVLIERYKLKSSPMKVLVFCGLGNNGGDGFVAARKLVKETKCKVKIILPDQPVKIKTKIARANFKKLRQLKSIKIISKLQDKNELNRLILDSELILDAMLGVGITGALREPYKQYVNAINANARTAGITVISVDAPTGLGTRAVIKPQATITFHDIKEGMTKGNSGEVIIQDIGIPHEAAQYTGPGEVRVYYPKPLKAGHKGDNGRVLVIGGGPYTGAPALAGLAAYRTGVDLVRIATPRNCYPIIASYSPNFIVHPLIENYLRSQDVKSILDMTRDVECVIIGPGLGDRPATKKAVRAIIKNAVRPFVIDADAIKAVGEDLSVLAARTTSGVITPHAGELRLLTNAKIPEDISQRSKQIIKYAKKLKFTIVLKGEVDVISDGRNLKLNRTGNPGMTVGGTGDVLAGIIGGLIAKGLSPYNAARLGAFINGYGGDLAFEEKGYSMMATDIIDKIPVTLKKFII